jgi:hypothetical protein
VNQAAMADSYPIPRIDDLFASLAGGKTFLKLDLAHAYQQVELEEELKKVDCHQHPKGPLPIQQATF